MLITRNLSIRRFRCVVCIPTLEQWEREMHSHAGAVGTRKGRNNTGDQYFVGYGQKNKSSINDGAKYN
jgi:hypothetical protein